MLPCFQQCSCDIRYGSAQPRMEHQWRQMSQNQFLVFIECPRIILFWCLGLLFASAKHLGRNSMSEKKTLRRDRLGFTCFDDYARAYMAALCLGAICLATNICSNVGRLAICSCSCRDSAPGVVDPNMEHLVGKMMLQI